MIFNKFSDRRVLQSPEVRQNKYVGTRKVHQRVRVRPGSIMRRSMKCEQVADLNSNDYISGWPIKNSTSASQGLRQRQP